MEVTYKTGEAIVVEAALLSTFVARLGFATVYDLQVEEVPQPVSCPVAILNVTGWCAFPNCSPGGLCVMVVGRDAMGGILWACCLMAQPGEEGPEQMLESLLVAPEVLGRTTELVIRVYGGYFRTDDRVERGLVADRPSD